MISSRRADLFRHLTNQPFKIGDTVKLNKEGLQFFMPYLAPGFSRDRLISRRGTIKEIGDEEAGVLWNDVDTIGFYLYKYLEKV